MTLWGSHLPSKLRSPGSGPWSEYKRPIEFRTEPLRTPCVPARVRWSGHGCGPGHRMLTLTFGQWEQRGRQYLYRLPEPGLGKALPRPGSEALGSLPMALPMPNNTHSFRTSSTSTQPRGCRDKAVSDYIPEGSCHLSWLGHWSPPRDGKAQLEDREDLLGHGGEKRSRRQEWEQGGALRFGGAAH